MRNEFGLIHRLTHLIPRSLQGPYGIGDDCAILPVGGGKSLLFTTDVIVEGVDFLIGKGGARPEAVGHKALAVNLSDIAAMGGRPLAFVVAWGIPKNFSQDWIARAGKGMVRLARKFRVAWVGGDISRAGRLFISIALLGEGETRKLVRRKGAKPGDLIYVTGTLGGSILGKHLDFMPRLAEAQFLVRRFHPTSLIDISDGFIQDLEHLLKASRVGAMVDLDRIPISGAARSKSKDSQQKALQSALTDGEDFELLFTLPCRESSRLENVWRRNFPRLSLTRVGEILHGAPKIKWVRKGERARLWFHKKGYTHF